ncbi:interleukin-18 receptor 1-like isoform X2 [Phycodurus eques]|uniref:interleukin-18 receptor 1-like isoform X2 n=1 Tax=Phycodurus eques TaxID=693459 RepID=UPI002ACD8172|nr:interleukin-18 receptor 1-like isoform X2 [Phycodurus eques]
MFTRKSVRLAFASVIIMRAPLLPLLLLLTSLTGVCVASLPLEIYVKAGEMVVLECPQQAGSRHDRCPVMWTSENKLQMDRSSMSPAEQRETGLLCLGRSLFILTASVSHEGNYLCSQRNVSGQSWFRLTVYTTLSRELKDRTQYLQECYTQESCLLNCPEDNIPNPNNPNFTAYDIIWRKEGESTQEVDSSFSSAVDTDHGVYTCTRPYLYDGQIYNMSFTVVLDIRPSQPNVNKHTVISSPQPNTTIFVDVGSPFVTECVAVFYSDFTPLFWLSGNTFVEMNDSFPVFSNYTCENVTEGVKKTVYLVFKEVTEENVFTNYTCKMESISDNSSFVTITLAKRDGKIYDVFLMCYKSDRVTGLNPCDTMWLVNVLEENLGYKLCLYDRDVQPGKALSEALLDCIEQSQSVVLVPSPVAHSLESGLLSAIHAALVERKTSLVIIKPESAEEAKWGSLPEAFRLLDKTGHCVTWEGLNALPPSASFWKKLRYHLPAVCTGTKAFPLDARLS